MKRAGSVEPVGLIGLGLVAIRNWRSRFHLVRSLDGLAPCRLVIASNTSSNDWRSARAIQQRSAAQHNGRGAHRGSLPG